MAAKASIYQAQGNLQEAARFLSGINGRLLMRWPSQSRSSVAIERNYGEAIRLLQARLAQFHFASEYDKADAQVRLAYNQRLAGDTAGAKVTAEQARNTLEQLYRDQPDDAAYSQSNSVSGLCRDGREGLGPKGSGACSHASGPVLKIRWTDLALKRIWR